MREVKITRSLVPTSLLYRTLPWRRCAAPAQSKLMPKHDEDLEGCGKKDIGE